jgi:hypothetical protein
MSGRGGEWRKNEEELNLDVMLARGSEGRGAGEGPCPHQANTPPPPTPPDHPHTNTFGLVSQLSRSNDGGLELIRLDDCSVRDAFIDFVNEGGDAGS